MDKAIQNEIEAYFRKAEERLEVAKLLNEHGAFEDAVSRAYYAIYHAAQAALLMDFLFAGFVRHIIQIAFILVFPDDEAATR